MLELRNRNEVVWPEALRPIQDDQDNKEPLSDWQARHADALSHLHPLVQEQWIYRHFQESRPRAARLVDGDIANCGTSRPSLLGGPPDPDCDYRSSHDGGGFGPVETVRRWANGTWNIPPVFLETPLGVRS